MTSVGKERPVSFWGDGKVWDSEKVSLDLEGPSKSQDFEVSTRFVGLKASIFCTSHVFRELREPQAGSRIIVPILQGDARSHVEHRLLGPGVL